MSEYGTMKVSAVLLNEGQLTEKLKEIGINVFVIDESKNSVPVIIMKLIKLIKKHKFNVLHSHRYKENFIAALVSLFFNRLPIVTTLHGLPEILGAKSSLMYRFISELNYKILQIKFSSVVSVSFGVTNFLLSRCRLSEDKVITIHNGIAVPDFKVQSKNSNEKFVIGTAGRLFPVKNFNLLLDIACRLKDHNIVFKIAGDGPERAELEKKCRRLCLEENVIFCGNVKDMQGFYSNLDLYINTSLHEGIPISILEAMCFFIPIVAPRVGGIPEIINEGKEGFLINPSDIKGFADACYLLYTNQPLRNEMSFNARKRVQESFTVESCAQSYRSLYESLVNNYEL